MSRFHSSLRLNYRPLYGPHFVHPFIHQGCSPCFVNHVAVNMGVQTSLGFHRLPRYRIFVSSQRRTEPEARQTRELLVHGRTVPGLRLGGLGAPHSLRGHRHGPQLL